MSTGTSNQEQDATPGARAGRGQGASGSATPHQPVA